MCTAYLLYEANLIVPQVVDCCLVVCMCLNCRHVRNFARGSAVVASVIIFSNDRLV